MAAPRFSNLFSKIHYTIIDSTYKPPSTISDAITEDLNGDGHQDLVIFGSDFPSDDNTSGSPQPSRVLLGDGNGGFVIAPDSLFPVNSLLTVSPRKVLFADFNKDGRPDMFVASHGWDAEPFPGEQNRLMLSRPGGGWVDATSNLPQIIDFTHSAAVGDIDNDGDVDILVGNYFGNNMFLPYILFNDGTGHFEMNRSKIPVGTNQVMDLKTGHSFIGATLVDLNEDNLPELIITADAGDDFKKNTRNIILWNKNGIYSENNKTVLPAPPVFAESQIVLDCQSSDINRDGLLDLIFAGTKSNPAYDGWFVQILINKGNRKFVDETKNRLKSEDMFGGVVDQVTGTSWPLWITVLDYNEDGFIDFALEFNDGFGQDQPFIWLNDSSGHFTTLKVSDFISPGDEWSVGTLHLTQTQNGYSIFRSRSYQGEEGLSMAGLLAKRPFKIPTVSTSFTTNIENTSVTSGGEVTDDNGIEVTSRGVCWSTSVNPTLADQKTLNGSGTGVYQSYLTNLAANTKYYVRSWAKSYAGTGYGNEVSFTSDEGLPTVKTEAPPRRGESIVTGGGNVINDGGVEVTSRGICWSTTANPTISDQKTISGVGSGPFQSNLTDLVKDTTYYIRAWATNSYGTAYGNEVTFSNASFPWIFLIPIISNVPTK